MKPGVFGAGWAWAAAAVVAGSAQGQVANRLANPGFESGPDPLGSFIAIPAGSTALAGWTVSGAPVNYRGDLPARDGQRLAELVGTGPTLRQAVTTRAGALYVVDGWLATRGAPGGLIMNIRGTERGSNEYRAMYVEEPWNPPAGPRWQEFSQTWTASGASSTIEMNASGANAAIQVDAMSVREVAPPFGVMWTQLATAQCANNLILIGSGRSGSSAIGVYAIGRGSPEGDPCAASRIGVVRVDQSGTQVTEAPLSIVNEYAMAACVAGDGTVWIAALTQGTPSSTISVYSTSPPYTSITPRGSIHEVTEWDRIDQRLAMCEVPGRGPMVVYRYHDYHAPIGGGGPFPLSHAVKAAYLINGTWLRTSLAWTNADTLIAEGDEPPLTVIASPSAEVTVAWAGRDNGYLSSWTIDPLGTLTGVRMQVTGSGRVAWQRNQLSGAYFPGGDEATFITANTDSLNVSGNRVQPWRMGDASLPHVLAETNWTDTAGGVFSPALHVAPDATAWMAWTELNPEMTGSVWSLRVLRGRNAGPCCYDRYQRLRFAGSPAGPYLSEYNELRVVARDEAHAEVFYNAGNELHLGRIRPSDRGWPCPGDFDGSGEVGVGDVFEFLAAWFGAAPDADVDRSGQVSLEDLFTFLGSYFAGCG